MFSLDKHIQYILSIESAQSNLIPADDTTPGNQFYHYINTINTLNA